MPDSFTIRPEGLGDSDAIDAILRAAFPGPEEAVLVKRLRQGGMLSISLVAERQRALLGHVAFSPVTLEGLEQPAGLGLAPVAVLPEAQRQGIGAALIRHGLQTAKAMGYGYAVVLGDPAYYSRFGFQPAKTFGLNSAYPEAYFQAMELQPGSLAQRQGPSNLGIVRYCAAFEGL